jgi:hypothetical protein
MKDKAVIGPPETKYPGSEIVATKTACHTPLLFEYTPAGFCAAGVNSQCFPVLPAFPGTHPLPGQHTSGYTKALTFFSGKSSWGVTRIINRSIAKSIPVYCDGKG